MSSFNRATIMGRLGKDPEVKSFDNGGSVCTFSVATGDKWTDKETGEKKERTDWHNVAIFNENLIKVAEQYLTKGDLVFLEGEIRTRKYEKDGSDRYVTEIVLPKFGGTLRLMPKGGEGGRPAPSEDSYGQAKTRETTEKDYRDAKNNPPPANGGSGRYNDLDADIPFAPEWRG